MSFHEFTLLSLPANSYLLLKALRDFSNGAHLSPSHVPKYFTWPLVVERLISRDERGPECAFASGRVCVPVVLVAPVPCVQEVLHGCLLRGKKEANL